MEALAAERQCTITQDTQCFTSFSWTPIPEVTIYKVHLNQLESSHTTGEFGPCVQMTAWKNNRFVVTKVHYKLLSLFLLHMALLRLLRVVSICWSHGSPTAWSTTQEHQWKPFVNCYKIQENRVGHCSSPTYTHKHTFWYWTVQN